MNGIAIFGILAIDIVKHENTILNARISITSGIAELSRAKYEIIINIILQIISTVNTAAIGAVVNKALLQLAEKKIY